MNRKQIKKLDNIWRDLIKARDNYTCRKCGKRNPFNHSAHIISRGHYPTRWDLMNGLCLCPGCHTFGFAHSNPLTFAEWVRQEIGEENYQELIRKSNEVKKMEFEETLRTLEGTK